MKLKPFFITCFIIMISQVGLCRKFNSAKSREFTILPNNSLIIKAENYILLNQVDSAQLILKSINDSTFTEYIQFLEEDILTSDYLYENLFTFIAKIGNSNSIPKQYIYQYIESLEIETPSPEDGINKGYTILISGYLGMLSGYGFVKEASPIYANFTQYLDQFPEESAEKELGQYSCNVYLINLCMSNRNIDKGLELCKKNIEIGQKYRPKENESSGSIEYLIKAYSMMLPFIRLQGNLDKYIEHCQLIFDLENQYDYISSQHKVNVFDMLDALIHKTYTTKNLNNRDDIISLLNEIHNSKSGINSAYYYVKYMILVDEHSKEAQDIYNLFDVNNFLELCELAITKAKKGLSNVQLIKAFKGIKRVLKSKGYINEALKLSEQTNGLLQKSYNKDLSEQLAKFDISIANKEKAHAENILETRSKLFTYIFIFLFLLLLIIAWVVRFQKIKNKALDQANREKMMLLKEIHHRVKNNFQIASGLLELQFREVKDQHIHSLIQEWQGRINAMTSVHQTLYQNKHLTVDLEQYVLSITNDLNKVYGNHQTKIDINFKDQYTLNIDTCINLGLILTELITNAFKYGKKDDVLSLSISCEKNGDEYKLHLADQGHGFPPSIDLLKQRSLGIRLIKELSKKLHGNMEYYSDNGAHFIITFKKVNG